MHRNWVWLTFLSTFFLITLWFAGVAFYQLYQYQKLKASTTPTTISWSVQELGSEAFVPFARYSYLVNGREYRGEGAYRETVYRNPKFLEQEIGKFEKKVWKVWYNPSYPDESSLQRRFPMREFTHAGVLTLLLLYMIGLGTYVGIIRK